MTIRGYLFWRQWKDKLHECKDGMSTILYGIAPNSYKITKQNWAKMGIRI